MNDVPVWLGFVLEGQHYAVPLPAVREVIRAGDVTPVPGSPDEVLGVVNLRGQIVCVLDGRRRFGLTERVDAHDDERIMVLEQGDETVGMRIDAVGDMLTVAAADIAVPPPGRASRRGDPVSGVFTRGDGFVALVDVERLCRL
jgi:purine-binding chemotaxis protein CheW